VGASHLIARDAAFKLVMGVMFSVLVVEPLYFTTKYHGRP
ncbi:unnamed protein product, partial [Acidithrix sp. C25]